MSPGKLRRSLAGGLLAIWIVSAGFAPVVSAQTPTAVEWSGSSFVDWLWDALEEICTLAGVLIDPNGEE